MAVLPTIDLARIYKGLMRYWSQLREPITTIGKVNIYDAVVAADAWVDGNAASYNSALPAPFRNNATLEQKSLLLAAIILMRFNIQLLKKVFGEVE